MSLQSLIDALEKLEAQDDSVKLVLVFALLGLIIGPPFLYKTWRDRRLVPLLDKNKEIRDRLQRKRELLEQLQKERDKREEEIETLKATTPQSQLQKLHENRKNRNEAKGIKELRKYFSDITPGLIDCCIEISRNEATIETADAIETAERYARIAYLLDPSRADVRENMQKFQKKCRSSG